MDSFWSAVDKLTTVGVARLKFDRRIEKCNKVFASFTGQDAQHLIGQDFIKQFVAKEDYVNASEWCDSLITGEETHCHGRLRLECPVDHSRVYCDIEAISIHDQQTSYIMLFASRLNDGEEQIGDLQSKMQELQELVATLSATHGVTFNVSGTDGKQIATRGGRNTDNHSTTNSTMVLVISSIFMAAVLLGFFVLAMSGKLNIKHGGQGTSIDIESRPQQVLPQEP